MSLNINQLSYTHPDREILFGDINFSVSKGEKISLIGNNGSGKSTLLQILAGRLKAAGGEIVFSEKPYYVPQHFGQYDDLTVAGALHIEDKLNAFYAILQGDATEENFNMLNDDWDIEERALSALSKWDLSHIQLSQLMSTLSGGEKTKVFLSGIDVHTPEIILLDEPTNHLDKKSRKQLYDFVNESKSSIVVVSHDRTLLNFIDSTYELNETGIELYGGNYEFYKIQKDEKLNALEEQVSEKEKALRKAKKIAREAIERKEKENVRGKKKKLKERALPALINKLEGKAEQSTAKLKSTHTNKIENIITDLKEAQEKLPSAKDLKIKFEDSNLHSGKILIDAKSVNFSYGSGMLWKNPLDIQIRSGERIVISGGNGSGKTTLIKLILNELEPSTGSITRTDFSYLYIDQEYTIIDNGLTVFEQVEKFNSRHFPEHDLKMLLHRFLFSHDTWEKKCDKLSGGEKMKLMFCCMQVNNSMPDLFVLDEPTNNLDIQSIEIITSVIKSYKGTILIISHDEYFINEININREISLT